MPPVSLLVGGAGLPSSVTSTGYTAVQKDVTVPPFPRLFGAEGFALRTWGPSESGPAFAQMVLDYPSTETARREYGLAPHGRTYNDPDMGRLTPEPYERPPLRADAFNVACLRSPLDLSTGCSRWTFRARYGRYLVEVGFGAQGPGRVVELGGGAFGAMLSTVDGHVSGVLRGERG
ncbi:hypothetical protein [Sphaerisporangium sp. TRM90804]|uniref:hypothetical protein n=1 Tax=Sphaerisporangium sp. TRM90804 TaxID=3031113 RepID=UPI00244C351F|nr:hypothetical protein [Sphaerisporangium sp. TRM90804]MDH2430519.1 hypothetical protein [Sphaerisporangium sp. TRM90804]